MQNSEKEIWDQTAAMLGDRQLKWGDHWSYNFKNDPKRLGFVLSRYKFASKMIGKNRSILELGCGEGIGATILAEHASHYTGVDLDYDAIETAKQNLNSDKFSFIYDDFMKNTFGTFQAIISLDVIEHIYQEHEVVYFKALCQNLSSDGIVIVGTPNLTAASYASEASHLGHVNLFTQKRLKTTLEHYFHHVFPFGMNDEVMHTGFESMAHYIFCLCCNKRR